MMDLAVAGWCNNFPAMVATQMDQTAATLDILSSGALLMGGYI